MKVFRAKLGKPFAKPEEMFPRFGEKVWIDDVSENCETVFFIFPQITQILVSLIYVDHIFVPTVLRKSRQAASIGRNYWGAAMVRTCTVRGIFVSTVQPKKETLPMPWSVPSLKSI